jgi:L-fuconolactonase
VRIDAHQHFWRYLPEAYPWMGPDWPIRRDFLPTDLEPLLAANGLQGSIAVQARQSLEETRWLLELADASPCIVGVVGWVDLRAQDVLDQLKLFSAHPKLVGVRHVVQDEPDDGFMLKPEFQRGIAALAAFDLAYDILIFPRQLPAAIELARRFPNQRFVLDHLAKPQIREHKLSPWRDLFRELAQLPNVWAKLSGLVTEAAWQTWQPADLAPYLRVAFDAFGPQRLLFGSDWPVALLAADYDRVVGVIRDHLATSDGAVQDAVFGGTVRHVYGLDRRPKPRATQT